MNSIERAVERVIFASRWFQVPLYLGLVAVLVMLAAKFVLELGHLSVELWTMGESSVVLAVLTLVDVVMVANLIVMVVISGYENFVSRLELEDAADKLSWFGKLDAGSLKIKLASSIVAISSIHLLKAFLDVNDIPNDKVLLLIAIHLTFIASALLLAYLDRMVGHRRPDGDRH
ncbi:TIGR00645 family protein [Sphingomonas daechungensis]|uniref:TIGR00645 family protein n=1 Tax=Sphingomonas daechungensis TaxID=1176646 RepID=UPI0037833201